MSADTGSPVKTAKLRFGFTTYQWGNQLQTALLAGIGWDGWALLEVSDKVADRVQGLIEQRQIWEQMVANGPTGKR